MAFNSLLLLLSIIPALSNAREIVFPSVSGYTTDQTILGGYNEIDVSQAKFAGLTTYANLPYVHCLAPEGEGVEKFDIAILGAPFDTVSGQPRIAPVECVYPKCTEGDQLSAVPC
jgi:agmatinase